MLLSDALERHSGVFNQLYISLVKAGEVSGQLAETLEELSKLKTAKIIPTQKREKGKGRPTKKERRIIDKLQKKY